MNADNQRHPGAAAAISGIAVVDKEVEDVLARNPVKKQRLASAKPTGQIYALPADDDDDDADEHIEIDEDDDDGDEYSDVEGAGGIADGMGEDDMDADEGVAIDDDEDADEMDDGPGQQDARIVNITKNDAQTRSEDVLQNQARSGDKAGNDPILVVYNQQQAAAQQ